MSTLPNFTPSFNSNLHVSATGGALSIDGGMVPFIDFISRSHFDALYDETLAFSEKRTRVIHSKESCLKQVIC